MQIGISQQEMVMATVMVKMAVENAVVFVNKMLQEERIMRQLTEFLRK
ncbi:MAG: hypothetical protein V1908_01810 [Candidatus Peregrinibacteria bacterium]